MLRHLLTIILLFSLTGCVKPNPEFSVDDRVLIFDNTDDMSQLIWGYATELKYEKHLRLEQSYVISGENHSTIHIEFSTQDILELCEARQLLVDVVEGLLDRVNNSAVAFSLEPDPFTADHLEIYIDFESYYGLWTDPFYIGWVALEGGMSYFYAFTLKYKDLDFWHSRYEPYFQSKSFALFQRAAEQQYEKAHPKKKPSILTEERYHPL